MSGSTKETYVWAPTQAIEVGSHIAAAVSAELEGYEPGHTLTLMQGNKGRLREAVAAALARFVASLTSPFKHDKTKDGWELVKPEGDDWRQWPADPTAHGPAVPSEWDPTRIPELFEEVSFVREGDGSSINGLVMRKLALKKYGCPDGQFLAEWLQENQQYIPESWRGHYLVFPGTVWRDRDGCLVVAGLRLDAYRWGLRFYWLDRDFWYANDRLMRRCDSSV